MKIGVCLKEVPDTASKIEIREDGKGIRAEGLKFIINPYDEFALEEALKKKDQDASVEVVIFTVGPARAVETIRKGLAMGADKAVHCVEEDLLFCDTFTTASLLATMIKKESVDFLFLGKQAVDDDCYQVGPMLGGLLGWSQAMNVIELEMADHAAKAVREVEGGAREILELKAPFVIGMTKGINEPRYPNLKGIMAAKKKTIENVSASDLGVDMGAKSGFEVESFELPPERGAVQMIEGDVAEQAQTLVKKLREEAKVL